MSPLQVRVAKLIDDVRRDWDAVEAHLQRAQSVDPAGGDPEAALVALSLDHAYQAFETLLVRLERALGLPERTGASWHTEALLDAGRPLPQVRPAVYPDEATGEWEELLRFRHFLRHAYTVSLDPDRLRRNRSRLDQAVAATRPHIRALVDALADEG